MLLKTKLQNYKNSTGAKWEIIEQDYVLSWILAGIASSPDLRENLAFKGGTCLRKCYFGDYRFSQDVDLSVIGQHEKLERTLESNIEKACELSESLVQDQGESFYLQCFPYKEKQPHPEGQQAFLVQAKFPWHRDFLTKVYIEVSFNEKVILQPVQRAIIHPYDDAFDFNLQVYGIDEIIAEKIRALLQFSKKLHERGWGRSRVRDYYDLWSILKHYAKEITPSIIPNLTREKCAYKSIVFNDINDIFNEKLILNVEEEWESWLGGVVAAAEGLPEKNAVIQDLKENLGNIFNLRSENLGVFPHGA